MKALLLRVGIDKGSGGCLAPIFEDGSFEYIPIPEEKPTDYPHTYSQIIGKTGLPLSSYIPDRLRDKKPHFDPEFETFTYGDPTHKTRQLRKLAPGDLLCFYSGLRSGEFRDMPRLFLIGVFEVDRVHEDAARSRAKIGNNAHFFRRTKDRGLVIIQGRRKSSVLFKMAVPLGDARDRVLRDLEIGYEGSLSRAIGHWIEGKENIRTLKRWVDSGPVSLVQSGNRLFSYVVDKDTGFAPNPEGGYCTLACCKQKIRATAEPGDWVVGLCPVRHGWSKVVFAMRISEKLEFDEFCRDERFTRRLDNIYHRSNGRFKQKRNPFHNKKDLSKDTSADVLIGSIFWYFGGDAKELR